MSKKKKPLSPNLKTITLYPLFIFSVFKSILKDIPEFSKFSSRGRKPVYPLHFILYLLLLQRTFNLSYRTLEKVARMYFKEVPDFSTYFYRIKKIPSYLLNKVLMKVVEAIERELAETERRKLIFDGTGFGFNLPFYQRIKRGAEIRCISSHIKVVSVLCERRGRRYFSGVICEKAYTDERVLSRELVKILWERKLLEEGDMLFGDKLYGMDVELLKWLLEREIKPVIAIKEGIHNRVRNSVRMEVMKIYRANKELYRNTRYKIEQSIGNIKNAFGSYIGVKREDIAEKMVIIGFLAYNLVVYMKILVDGGKLNGFVIFSGKSFMLILEVKLYYKI